MMTVWIRLVQTQRRALNRLRRSSRRTRAPRAIARASDGSSLLAPTTYRLSQSDPFYHMTSEDGPAMEHVDDAARLSPAFLRRCWRCSPSPMPSHDEHSPVRLHRPRRRPPRDWRPGAGFAERLHRTLASVRRRGPRGDDVRLALRRRRTDLDQRRVRLARLCEGATCFFSIVDGTLSDRPRHGTGDESPPRRRRFSTSAISRFRAACVWSLSAAGSGNWDRDRAGPRRPPVVVLDGGAPRLGWRSRCSPTRCARSMAWAWAGCAVPSGCCGRRGAILTSRAPWTSGPSQLDLLDRRRDPAQRPANGSHRRCQDVRLGAAVAVGRLARRNCEA